MFDLDDTLFDHQLHRRNGLRALQALVPALVSQTLPTLEQRHELHLQTTYQAMLRGELDLEWAREVRMRRLLADFGVSADGALVETCERAYREGYGHPRHVVPGALELLRALRNRGMRIAILTNGETARQRAKLVTIGLLGLADVVITSQVAGAAKPELAFYKYAFGRLGVRAVDCVAVGDLWDIDIEGALAAGIAPIWLNRYGHTRPREQTQVREIQSFLPLEDALRLFSGGAPPPVTKE